MLGILSSFLLSTQRQLLSPLIWLSVLLCPAAYAQAPSWQSVTAIGGENSNVAATVADANGNIYVTGSFNGTVTFGSITLTSAGSSDVFVAKWNSATASFLWAKGAGGTAADGGTAIAVQGTSVFIAGSINSSIASFGNTNLSSLGAGDAFIAKLTDNGNSANFTWALSAGGTRNDVAVEVTTEGANIYMAGFSTSSTAAFGQLNLVNTSLGNGSDAFVAKLTDAGSNAEFIWVQRVGGPNSENIQGLSVNGKYIYVGGSFDSKAASLGNLTLLNANNTASLDPTFDIFVAKLTDTGSSASFSWALRAGGADLEIIQGLAVHGSNVYIAGELGSIRAEFGDINLRNTDASGQTEDVFVAKILDTGSTGSFVWAQQAGGMGYDYANAITVIGSSLYITGNFDSPIATFGTSTISTVSNNVAYDIFVAKLTDVGSTGNFVWAQQAGGLNDDWGRALAVSGSTIYVGGYVTPIANFGNLSVATGTKTGYIASLSDANVLAATMSIPKPELNLYPNPAHTYTTINVPPSLNIKRATLILSDQVGRILYTQELTNLKSGTIDLSVVGLTPGLYHLRILAGDQHISRSLVVD